MPALVPLVEGDGEIDSVPLLLRRFQERVSDWSFNIAPAKNAHGKFNILKPGGFERFLELCFMEPECQSVLVLLDADNDCAFDIANGLANRARNRNGPAHVAIVVAKHEYETWFIASLHTIATDCLRGQESLSAGVQFTDPYEAHRNPKSWISNNMPQGRIYKETFDQARMTRLIDIDSTYERCRSFRRMFDAFEQLRSAMSAESDARIITPSC
jgi:hypothetical protein